MKDILVPDALRTKVTSFLDAHNVSWRVVDAEPCDLCIEVHSNEERRQSGVGSLEAGGWIKCATAWAMAKRHGIPLGTLGELLDELDIKVRHCSLGCFE